MALRGNDAAFVAAALVQAEATIMAGYAANRRISDETIISSAGTVEALYKHYLAFVLAHEPDPV